MENQKTATEQNSATSPEMFKFSVNPFLINKKEATPKSYRKWQERESTVEDLIAWIKAGNAWSGATFAGRLRRDKFLQGQLIALDFDGGFPLAEALADPFFEKHALFIHTTASHQQEKENAPATDRFRVVFALPRPVWEGRVYEAVLLALAEKYPQADSACLNCNRTWRGNSQAEVFRFEGTPLRTDLLLRAVELGNAKALQEEAAAERRAAIQSDPIAGDRALIEAALAAIPPRDPGSGNYPVCLSCCFAVAAAFPENDAIQILEAWSPSQEGWSIPQKVRDSNGRVGLGTLFYWAALHGWQRPKAKQSDPEGFEAICRERAARLEKFTPDYTLDSRYFPDSLPIPQEVQIIGIRAAKGTGKTKFLAEITTNDRVLLITHRIKLEEQLGERFKVETRRELTDEGRNLGHSLCINSLHLKANPPFNPDDYGGYTIILDEFDQSIWNLANSSTTATYRMEILDTLQKVLRQVIDTGGKIYLASADLADRHIEFLRGFIGGDIATFLIENTHVPESKAAYCFNDRRELLASAVNNAKQNNQRILCFVTSVRRGSENSSYNLEEYFAKQGLSVLRVDAESTTTPGHPAENVLDDLHEIFSKYNVVIASPVLETGVSIEGNIFDAVYYFGQSGVQSINAIQQSLGRVRAPVPRYFYVPKLSPQRIWGGETSWGVLQERQNLQANKNLASQNLFALAGVSLPEQPFMAIYAKEAALINCGLLNYRLFLCEKLALDGYMIKEGTAECDKEEIKKELKEIKQKNQIEYCEQVAAAPPLTEFELAAKQKKRRLTDTERQEISRAIISNQFDEPEVSPDLVKKTEEGFYTQAQLHYYLKVGNEFLEMRDCLALNKLLHNGKGRVFPVDMNKAMIGQKVALLQELEIEQFLDNAEIFTNDRLADWFDRISSPEVAAKMRVLGITPPSGQTPIAFLNQKLLPRLGLQLQYQGRKMIDGVRQRVYAAAPTDGREIYFDRWAARDTARLAEFEATGEVRQARAELIGLAKAAGWQGTCTPLDNVPLDSLWDVIAALG